MRVQPLVESLLHPVLVLSSGFMTFDELAVHAQSLVFTSVFSQECPSIDATLPAFCAFLCAIVEGVVKG